MGVKGQSGPPGNCNAVKHGAFSKNILGELLALPAGAEDLRDGIAELHDTILADFGGEAASPIDKALVSLGVGLLKQSILLTRSIVAQGGGVEVKSLSHLLDSYGRAQRALLALQAAAKEAKGREEGGDPDERPLDAAGLKAFYQQRGLL